MPLMLCLNECGFHLPPQELYRLQTSCHLLPFQRLVPKHFGLCRTKIPRANEGALETIQPASTGGAVSAALKPFPDQLVAGDRDGRQVQKEQILEIEPDAGVPAADIGAVGTGGPAKTVHGRKDRCELIADLCSRLLCCFERWTVSPPKVFEGGIGLIPLGSGVPGYERKRRRHADDISLFEMIFQKVSEMGSGCHSN